MRHLVPATVKKVGADRCADRLGERLGLDVEPADISTLAEAGHLAVADVFEKKGRSYDLYALADIDAVTPGQVRPVIEKRAEGLDRSLSLDEAAARRAGTTAS
ncbi:hypothetical protein ACFXJ8_34550 [Nonomuraea sp. NPDC059194]|uniref:hypothetical protein n=1 Tax=Nonomuraea sp. NPDC059194 TaxID=3346764 RepID=UPI0036C91C5E